MMVTRIGVDYRQTGKRIAQLRLDCSDAKSAANAVEMLDGDHTTLSVFELKKCAVLAISGGNDGRYVIDVTYGDEEAGPSDFYYAISAPQQEVPREQELDLVTGGQCATYPPWRVVDKATAIEAAVHWCAQGEKSPRVTWLKDVSHLHS